MKANFDYNWNQQQNGQYTNGDTSLHSVHGAIHAGPHSIPAHTDNGVDPNLVNTFNNEDSGAFVSAGTAGQKGFDIRSLGLTDQELRETGLHASLSNAGRQLPLDQYKINYDPNPIVIRKQIPIEMPTYKQQVIVRYLRPPTPPSPGPLIIKEVREPQAAPAPPLVIRTRAPREKTPPPIVIREAPPNVPHIDANPQYMTRIIRPDEQSYSSSSIPQQQQQQRQQQHQQYQSFANGTVNYNQFNGIQNGNQYIHETQYSNGTEYTNGAQYVNGNQYQNEFNQYDQQQQAGWITELVSSSGTTSIAPPNLLDDIYRAVNNQLPRV